MTDVETSDAFTITADDIQVLRELRPRRMRYKSFEASLHLMVLVLALLVLIFAVRGHHWDRILAYLSILGGIWLLAWMYLALFMSSPSSKTRAWFDEIRRGSVLSNGPYRATIDHRSLTLIATDGNRVFPFEELDDWVPSPEHLFIRTVEGQILIVPKRAFASNDKWVEFCLGVQTRDAASTI